MSTTQLSERFIHLYNLYFDRLLYYALRFVNDKSEAEDIVCDVFYELWRKIDRINLDGGIATYLYRAVSSRALNALRHRNISAVRLEAIEAISEKRLEFIEKLTPGDFVENGELKSGINKALGQLPEKCREVFILSYVNGLKSKEIAEAMDISVRTVDAHLYKALRLMREKLRYLLSLTIFFIC